MRINYEAIFQENVIMTMDHLKLVTGRLRESILRDLKGIGYYSSYNARGKYYTLIGIPAFDSNGLWKFRNAFFSIRRTLLDTAEYLIKISDAGYTHDALRKMLGIEIQNSLLQLTTSGKLVRRRIGDMYIYFSNDNINEQEEKRRTLPLETITRKPIKESKIQIIPEIEPALVIDILVAVLRGHYTVYETLIYMNQKGSPVTVQQVEAVFQKYEICKKNS